MARITESVPAAPAHAYPATRTYTASSATVSVGRWPASAALRFRSASALLSRAPAPAVATHLLPLPALAPRSRPWCSPRVCAL